MSTDFNNMIWEIAKDSPDLQEAIKKEMHTESEGYSIPTREYSEVLEEVGDIHYSCSTIKDDERREKLMQVIKEVDSMTIGQLAEQLNYIRVAMLVKEIETGKELTDVEKTLRDIDITLLAFTAIKQAPKVIGRTKPLKRKQEE